MNKEDLNFIMVCAFRYCLGRMSYSPDFFREILEKNIHKISDNTKHIIKREIKESDNLGMDCDIRTWERVLEIVEE